MAEIRVGRIGSWNRMLTNCWYSNEVAIDEQGQIRDENFVCMLLYLDSFAFFCRVYLSASFFCISPSFSRFPTDSSPLYRYFFLISLYPFVHLHLFIPCLFISSCCFLFLPYSASYSSSCPCLTDRSLLSTLYPRLHRTTALSALEGGGRFDFYWVNHASGGIRNRERTNYKLLSCVVQYV